MYLESNPYSKARITEILKNDKYTDLEIVYAISESNVNFANEALRSKRLYIEKNNDIIDEELSIKLTSDGFTIEEITYALEND